MPTLKILKRPEYAVIGLTMIDYTAPYPSFS